VNRRILVDRVRRGWREFLYLAIFAALPWILLTDSGVNIHTALAVNLILAGFGAPAAWQSLALREIRVLPVSRRELWRTAWWLGLVGGVMMMTAGQLLGMAIGALIAGTHQLPLQTTGVTMVLSVAVAGINISANLFLNRLNARANRPRVVRIAVAVTALAGMMAMLAWPFAVRRTLPLTWREFNPAWLTVTFVGLALAIRSYFLHPAPPPFSRTAGIKRKARSFATISRIGGIGRMVFQTWKTATLVQLTIPAIVVVTMAVVSNVMFHGEDDGIRAQLRDFGLLPFEGAPAAGHTHNIFSLIYFLGASVFWWNLLAPGDSLLSLVRHLRTLPMSVRRVNALLLMLPVLTWINFWVLLFVLNAAVSDRPIATFSVSQWMAFIGADALTRAFMLRNGQVRAGKMVFGAAIVVSLLVGNLAAPALVAGGTMAFIVAVVLNAHTLSTSRKPYRPAQVQDMTRA